MTPELQREVVALVANGAFDYVAAQAAGISRSTFYKWYNAGLRSSSRYASFRQAVDEARSRARVIAENVVFREKPDVWLRYGPGRERPGAPGWTNAARPWADDTDAETLSAAAKKLAARYNLDAESLLATADILAREAERVRRAAGDPELFISQLTG